MPVNGAFNEIREQLAEWPGLEIQPHRFGGMEWNFGQREIGHIHGDALVDIPFPRKVRDEALAARLAEPHHVLPESGWVSVWLREAADVPKAVALLRRSYELALSQKERMKSL